MASAAARKPFDRDKEARGTDLQRLGRDDWIRAAITMLAENGVDALRIDELAKRLGVTKGSFYWHFGTRESLLEAVLETWRMRMTTDIQAYIDHVPGEPAARLSKLLRTALRPRPDVPGGPLELSLRDWARRDPKVQDVVAEVDAERIAFVARLYREAGLGEEQANESALAHLAITIGLRMLPFDGSREDLERRWKIAEAMLVPRGREDGELQ